MNATHKLLHDLEVSLSSLWHSPRSNPATKTDNSVWEVALASGEFGSDKAEYIIINARSGYFLTATGKKKLLSNYKKKLHLICEL
jgi:hypothetical protein